MLNEMKDIATSLKCKFRYEKKSMGFLSWMKGRTETVLLVADWREAKPIKDSVTG